MALHERIKSLNNHKLNILALAVYQGFSKACQKLETLLGYCAMLWEDRLHTYATFMVSTNKNNGKNKSELQLLFQAIISLDAVYITLVTNQGSFSKGIGNDSLREFYETTVLHKEEKFSYSVYLTLLSLDTVNIIDEEIERRRKKGFSRDLQVSKIT